MKRYVRSLILGCATLGILAAGASLWEPTVSANAPTCCSTSSECPGSYDKCCAVSGSSCSKDTNNQCLACTASPCSC